MDLHICWFFLVGDICSPKLDLITQECLWGKKHEIRSCSQAFFFHTSLTVWRGVRVSENKRERFELVNYYWAYYLLSWVKPLELGYKSPCSVVNVFKTEKSSKSSGILCCVCARQLHFYNSPLLCAFSQQHLPFLLSYAGPAGHGTCLLSKMPVGYDQNSL